MSLTRAYSLLTVKSFDADRRTFTGLATTPTPDRMGDVIESLGVAYKNPLPLLLYHDAQQPVGHVRFRTPTAAGIEFEATIAKVDEPASLRERVDTAWGSVKSGLLKGVSIGFRSIEHAFNKETGGVRFLKTEVLELSLVAVPANASATIHMIKSYDTPAPAASGTSRRVSSTSGVPDLSKVTSMNVSEQLTTEKAALQTKSARLEELMTADQTNGGLEADDQKELTTLTGEVSTLTAKIKNLSTLEAAQASMATGLGAVHPMMPTRTGRLEMKQHVPGTLFTRYALAVAAGKGSYSDTLAYAKRFTDTPEIAHYVKHLWDTKSVEGTAVVASPGWGGELVNPATAMTEFVELLMPQTIIGRVSGFRRVPFNIPVITQTGGSTFEWVGEGASKPVGELAFERTTLGWTKCAGIIVMTEELIRLSTPSAEALARADMIAQCAKFLDEQFIQVAIASGASNPASITYGVNSPAASGTDVDAVKADLMAALATFTAAKIPITGLTIVTTPDLALGISLLTNALGQSPAGFNVTPSGGTLLGYPVIVSESVDSGTLVIFKPSEIFLADDGQVRLDASNQATLDMNGGSPTSPVFSLWQRNCVGLRAERWINWQKRRPDVVAVIDTAAYGPAVGSP